MENIGDKIQAIAQELLEKQSIDLFIGYEEARLPLRSRPYFIRSDEGVPDTPVTNLVWNSFCSNNLAVFLPKIFETDPRSRRTESEPKPKVGVAVKGCDLRSVTALMQELQVPRDHVVLIGVPCCGMVDLKKVDALAAGEEIAEAEEADGFLVLQTRQGKTLRAEREDLLQECCLECRFPLPPAESVDVLVEGPSREPGDGGQARVREFESKTPEERWNYFAAEMSKCIRCNACRQACPTCWCKECFADQDDLRWIGVGTDLSDTMAFHLIRIFHQAGRCVECDACFRACPMGVDLRTFTKKIATDVEELFGHVPNFSLEDVLPLSTFSDDDSEEFISDPERAGE